MSHVLPDRVLKPINARWVPRPQVDSQLDRAAICVGMLLAIRMLIGRRGGDSQGAGTPSSQIRPSATPGVSDCDMSQIAWNARLLLRRRAVALVDNDSDSCGLCVAGSVGGRQGVRGVLFRRDADASLKRRPDGVRLRFKGYGLRV